ncbi:MAG: hypothetical protein JSS76_02570 [Bacteroidetes bacterium]|nr:hypothetical protein [Bacteroidota bacterium]
MKKSIGILMLFAVLLGTVVRDTSVSKAAKSIYTMTDTENDSGTSDDDAGDGKESGGKESYDPFDVSFTAFTFSSDICQTLFSSVTRQSRSIDHPYLESLSLPPELKLL